MLPLERSADEQPRGIAARDEQERDDRRGKRVERRTHIACQLFEQAGHGRARARVGVWMLDGQRIGEDRELGARLLDRDARPKAAEHTQHPRVAAADVRVEAERDPHLRHARPHRRRMKPIGEDADERIRPAAQDDRLSEHRGIALIAPRPQRVADDRDWWRAGVDLQPGGIRGQGPAGRRTPRISRNWRAHR